MKSGFGMKKRKHGDDSPVIARHAVPEQSRGEVRCITSQSTISKVIFVSKQWYN